MAGFPRHLPSTANVLASALAGALTQGCVLVPSAVDVYDPACPDVSRHLVLQTVQVAAIDRCANQGCVALVIAAAATAAASGIVSGSIVIVGNAAYWIERQANCRASADPQPR